MKITPNNLKQNNRNGSLYISVLLVSLIVSLLGMSALVVKRVQRRNHQSAIDASQARFIAQSALRMAMLKIESDPNWRYTFPNGTWEEEIAFAGGTYTIEGTDPSDSDLSDNPEEPVQLIGIGKKGNSIQKTQLTLSPINRGYDFLKLAMVSQGNITTEVSSVVFSNQILATNAKFEAKNNSTVTADVQATSTISGNGTYYGTTEQGEDAGTFPAMDDIFSYYTARGTWIDYNDINDQAPNFINNGGFEEGLDHWTADSCDISVRTNMVHAGAQSLFVGNRSTNSSGPTYDLSNNLEDNVAYTISFWGRAELSGTTAKFKIVLETETAADGVVQTAITAESLTTGWTSYTASLQPNWNGTLTRATLRIETDIATDNFLIDEVVVRGPDPKAGTIYKQVISPNHNPYGDPNAEGIYVIDCNNKDISIESCRIQATLVLLNVKNNSEVSEGPISWAPAKTNFPCLLVDGSFKIRSNNEGLNEAKDNVNYNPIGAAHAELGEDDDKTDTISSEYKGLIYASEDLEFDNYNSVEGLVLSGGTMSLDGTFTLLYNSIFYTNPPPGLMAPETIRILLDSVRKPLN